MKYITKFILYSILIINSQKVFPSQDKLTKSLESLQKSSANNLDLATEILKKLEETDRSAQQLQKEATNLAKEAQELKKQEQNSQINIYKNIALFLRSCAQVLDPQDQNNTNTPNSK